MEKSEMEKDGRLIISGDGVFYSLQGEGVTMGLPAVFLRLHLCNLKCVWCDTWYTWNEKTSEFWDEKEEWTIEETVKRIEEAWQCKNEKIRKRLVVTGGEPLLHQDKLIILFKKLPDWEIEIETNGTIIPKTELIKRCQFNCSPKASNSLNSRNIRIKQGAINVFKNANTFFKFVVICPNDVREVERDFVKPFVLDPNRVIIMPQGVTSEEIKANAQKVVEIVKSRGYRILLRLHVDLWGAKRRV